MANRSWITGVSADWNTPGAWTGDQVPGLGDNATIAASGTYTVTIGAADNITIVSATLDATNATLSVLGTLSPGTLMLDAGTATLQGGTIIGGTVDAAGGVMLFNGGELDGVTWDGTLDMSPASSSLSIAGGLAMAGAGGTGPGTLALTGSGSDLVIIGADTITNALINLGGGTSQRSLINMNTGTLTLAANTAIEAGGTNGLIEIFNGGTLINDGSIDANLTGGSFVIEPASVTNDGMISVENTGTLNIDPSGSFTNTGTLTVGTSATAQLSASTGFSNTGTFVIDSAGVLNLGGTTTLAGLGTIDNHGGTIEITGILDDTGATLSLTAGGAFSTVELGSGGTIIGGTVDAAGGVMLFNGGELDGVTWDGTLDVSPASSSLSIAGGLAMAGAGGTGPGTLALTGSGSDLVIIGADTITNALINLGGGTS